jgi:vacuolar-type H+-ATPase subunit F/Vma7
MGSIRQMEEELLTEYKIIIMSTKNIKKVKSQIDDLVNDPNFIRIGELLAEKRRLEQLKEKENGNKKSS